VLSRSKGCLVSAGLVNRIKAMVSGRRTGVFAQRSWGVEPGFYDSRPQGSAEQGERAWVRDLGQISGTDAWFDTDVNDIIRLATSIRRRLRQSYQGDGHL